MRQEKLTKREQAVKASNEKNLAKTKEQIEKATKNDCIVNEIAIKLMQELKSTHDENNPIVSRYLYTFAAILMHSKLKRLNGNEKTYNKANVELKRDVSAIMGTRYDEDGNRTMTGDTILDSCVNELSKLYVLTYKKNGDAIITCTDSKQRDKIMQRIASYSDNDALNIMHDCIITIFEKIRYALDNNIDTFPDTYLLEPFETVILSSTVYRNGEQKPKTLYKYRTTNQVKESSLTIGRSISANRAPKDDRENAYTSIESIIELEDGQERIVTTYHKAHKQSIIPICDINGKEIVQVADEQTENLIPRLLGKMNLTDRQAYIFHHYFMDGESEQQIADKLKISVDNVKVQLSRIKEKAIDTDIFSGKERAKQTSEKRAVACYEIVGKDENGDPIAKYLASFESVSIAAKSLNLDRGNITKVLKGKLNNTGNKIFKYE